VQWREKIPFAFKTIYQVIKEKKSLPHDEIKTDNDCGWNAM
jgi:hypothetical protein